VLRSFCSLLCRPLRRLLGLFAPNRQQRRAAARLNRRPRVEACEDRAMLGMTFLGALTAEFLIAPQMAPAELAPPQVLVRPQPDEPATPTADQVAALDAAFTTLTGAGLTVTSPTGLTLSSGCHPP
jgi:hypothetical protein